MDSIYLIFLSGLIFLTTTVKCDWGSPQSSQYHIQTDEGPERYFRYQTDNGQFRKEKRLQDGTVIGTDAWIDAFGYLRQKDYIADNQGYRILKSKTIFVGKDRPIQEAIQEAKNSKPQSGILVKSSSPFTTPRPVSSYSTTESPKLVPIVRNGGDSGYVYPTPNQNLVYDRPHSPTTTYLPVQYNSISSTTPKIIDITQHHLSKSSKYNQPLIKYESPTVITTPSSPVAITNFDRTPIAVYSSDYSPSTPKHYSSTTTSYSAIENTPQPYKTNLSPTAIASINNELLPPHISSNHDVIISSTTFRPPVAVIHPDNEPHRITPIASSSSKPIISSSYNTNSIENNVPLFSRSSVERNSPLSYQYYRPIEYSAQPSTLSQSTLSRHYNNNIDDQPQDSQYDGVSVTNNGFRYFLPRQYHEEENSGSSKRSGSFGYIDPFGIRRVIYYNTSPEGGFKHRKNNRYVGFDATPYDPRP